MSKYFMPILEDYEPYFKLKQNTSIIDGAKLAFRIHAKQVIKSHTVNDEVDSVYLPLLSRAILFNDYEMTILLLREGANPLIGAGEPILAAAQLQNYTVVEKLLAKTDFREKPPHVALEILTQFLFDHFCNEFLDLPISVIPQKLLDLNRDYLIEAALDYPNIEGLRFLLTHDESGAFYRYLKKRLKPLHLSIFERKPPGVILQRIKTAKVERDGLVPSALTLLIQSNYRKQDKLFLIRNLIKSTGITSLDREVAEEYGDDDILSLLIG